MVGSRTKATELVKIILPFGSQVVSEFIVKRFKTYSQLTALLFCTFTETDAALRNRLYVMAVMTVETKQMKRTVHIIRKGN
jgi:hypothetical protein